MAQELVPGGMDWHLAKLAQRDKNLAIDVRQAGTPRTPAKDSSKAGDFRSNIIRRRTASLRAAGKSNSSHSARANVGSAPNPSHRGAGKPPTAVVHPGDDRGAVASAPHPHPPSSARAPADSTVPPSVPSTANTVVASRPSNTPYTGRGSGGGNTSRGPAKNAPQGGSGAGMSLPASFGSIPVVANGVVGDIPSVPRLAIPTPDSGWETERGGDSGRGGTASDGGRPMTTREGSRRASRSRAMSGFKDIWDENRVDEVRGPSEVVSRAVSASIDTDVGGHAADSEDVVELLRGRPDVGPSGGQRLSALSLQRKAEKNRSQSAFAMGGGRRRSEALSAKGAGGGGGGAGGREAGPADFASAGLLAHFELQKMKAMGGVQGGAGGGGGDGSGGGGGGKAMIDEARLGKCCAIMETMTVKYFDEEIAQLKDELFRCIFRDFDKLERSGEPRTAQAFVDANPFFKLLDREKAKTRKLQEENKGSWIKLQELRETNARLEKRLEMLSLPSLEAPHPPGGEGDGRGGKGAAGRRPATGVDGVRGRGGVGRGLGRASTAVPGGGNNRHSRIQHQASTPFLGEGAGSDSLFDLFNANATVSVKHGGGAGAPGAVGKGGQQQQQHASATASTKATIMSGVEELKAAVIEGQKKNQGRDKDLTAMVYFGAAFKEVNKMVSSLNDFEEFEAAVNAKESGVESTVTTKTGQGFVKRRRGDMEARWRDFSKWLSRHPEAREKAETCGQLRPIYEDWKAGFEYKAEFSTMIRALERHKQVVVGKQICKDGSYKLSFSERVGENPMDPSSDEDEDMEELVAKRDETILMLQSKVQAIDQTVAACNEMNAQQMELRVGELEKLHLELESAEKKRQEEELAARDATIENLRGTLSECRQEIAQKDRIIAGLSPERMQEMEEKLKEMEKREKNMQNQVGEAMERVSEAKNKHAALAGEIEAIKAKQESNREEWNRKGKYMVERSERDKEEEKKQALLRLEEQHARQMSMYKEVLRKPAVISSERLNIILETFGMLQRAVGGIMQGVESLPEQDRVALASRTAREFDACHAALLESVTTEEEEEEAAARAAAAAGGGAVGVVGVSGGYGGGEIVEFVRLSDHGMQTEPMASDYMPEDGGGGKQGKGGKDKKGKKGDKKGDKKAAKVGWGTDEKLRNEMSVNLHRTIEVVYRHKEERDALQDGVRLPRDGPVTCLRQMLVEKHLRWEAAAEEEMRISSLALAFKGLDNRATLFGRLFGIFDPLPPAFCDCFMSLRRHASFKPAGARQVRWTRSVIDKGLPPDSEGELPRCEEGTVLSEVGRCALDLLCKQFRIETVLAERILSGYEMEDTLSGDVVLGVADIVLSAAKQMDVRSQIIIDAFQKTCQGKPDPAMTGGESLGGGSKITLRECSDIVKAADEKQALSDVAHSRIYVDVMREASSISAGVLSHPKGLDHPPLAPGCVDGDVVAAAAARHLQVGVPRPPEIVSDEKGQTGMATAGAGRRMTRGGSKESLSADLPAPAPFPRRRMSVTSPTGDPMGEVEGGSSQPQNAAAASAGQGGDGAGQPAGSQSSRLPDMA